MSNYRAIAFNPQTKKIEEAAWLDNCFGLHIYGVKFDDTEEVFRAHQCGLDAAAAELTRLQQSNAALEAKCREQGQEVAITRERDEALVALLNRLHDYISASNDWRPDSRLAREIRSALANA